MKISNPKKELAKIICENGGWRDGAEFSALQESGGDIWFCKQKPKYKIGRGAFSFNDFIDAIDGWFEFANWHQAILSRAEYFHLYPAQDADGWIEWKGEPKSPVANGVMVDVRLKCGACYEAELLDDPSWSDTWGDKSIIAYRPHKPEQAQPKSTVDMAFDIIKQDVKPEEPTVERLAEDYRNKLDHANRKQDEADKANMEADAALSELERAIAEIGFAITPIGAVAKESEPVITDWRDLMVGDIVWVDPEDGYITGGEYEVLEIERKEYDGVRAVRVERDGFRSYWINIDKGWQFIRRQAK